MDGRDVILEYRDEYRKGYTTNYVRLVYDEAAEAFKSIYLYSTNYGTLKFEDGKKEVHRWEEEDEAQGGGYLTRRWTTVFLNGVARDPAMEDRIIRAAESFVEGRTLPPGEREILRKGFAFLRGLGKEEYRKRSGYEQGS